jgi:putative oxidoreductase
MTITDRWNHWQRGVAARGWALVLLRLVVGYGFAAHGYAKLSRGPDSFAAILAVTGIPAPSLMAWLTTLLELLGGIAVLLGAFVAPLALPLGVIVAVAMFGLHLRYGFLAIKLKAVTAAGAEFGPVGYEMNVLYLAALIALALSPPTAGSIDLRLARWRAERGRRRALR